MHRQQSQEGLSKFTVSQKKGSCAGFICSVEKRLKETQLRIHHSKIVADIKDIQLAANEAIFNLSCQLFSEKWSLLVLFFSFFVFFSY